MADGALSDHQIRDLAKRMGLELAFVDFKSDLVMQPLEYNKGYIVNLADEKDKNGKQNEGTHWTAFIIRKYPNGKVAPCYFDSFGCQAPKEVADYIEHFTKIREVPYNMKDIQSLMSGVCGYYCLAWLYYINKYENRSQDLFHDTDQFLEFFEDLNKSIDFKKNEYILKCFFRSSNPDERIPISVENHMTKNDTDGITNLSVETKFV
jgi:hypothetical protein